MLNSGSLGVFEASRRRHSIEAVYHFANLNAAIRMQIVCVQPNDLRVYKLYGASCCVAR